ncbi:uncharacterized protein LOC117117907 [Anneissia japonica]|uniref:uncharacterized protein LOC117117907 n=1 Tax=Anneissia japonica TaxID=1529436 RepID=UPI0014254E28|nr:uncharacterized protein LOC117117907 [Anneissia japonica]
MCVLLQICNTSKTSRRVTSDQTKIQSGFKHCGRCMMAYCLVRLGLIVPLLLSLLLRPSTMSYVSYKKTVTTSIGDSAIAVTDDIENTCLQINTVERLEINMDKVYSVSMVTIINHVGSGECTMDPNMRDYRGIVSKTASGRDCQNWFEQWPHSHSYPPYAHNLCRADEWHEVWCYTLDAAVRWERCDIPDIGETCPRAPFTRYLRPLNTCYGVSHWLIFKESKLVAGVTDLSGQPVKINVPMNIKARIPNNERFQHCRNTFTLSFYIFPYKISNGPIIAFGNDNTRFSIVQTLSNDALYNSEVIVSYGIAEIVHAKVLLPESWTFLAVTFDGQHKVLTLWRDGEIASFGNTGFTSIQMDFDDIEVGSDAVGYDGVVAEVGYLQIYDRILNEAEMKAARDKQISKCDGLFHVTSPPDYSEEQPIVTSEVPSTIVCAFRCHHNLDCFVFRYNSGTKVCTEFQTDILDASNNHPIYKWRPAYKI